MSQRIRTKRGIETILNEVGGTGPGSLVKVDDFKTIAFQLRSKSSANLTVQFAASMSMTAPDFGSTATDTNPWFYVAVNDLGAGTKIGGTMGVAFTGTDFVNGYEVNTDYIKWFCPIVTAYSAGKVSCDLDAVNELS